MFSETVKVCAGEGDFTVEAEARYMGRDLCVSVTGGTGSHIGAVSLAVYEPQRDSATVSTVTVHTHRDDAVAARFAKEISREMKCTVSVSAGLHIDNAGKDEIAGLWENSLKCCEKIIALLKNRSVEE